MSHPRPPGSGRHRLHRKDDEVTRRRSGDANPRGKLERPEGLFRLRPDLAAPGDLPFEDALAPVIADWDRQVANGTISAGLIQVYAWHLKPLTGVLDRLGIHRVSNIDANTVLVWMRLPRQDGQPTARNVMAVRRSAARSFFQTAFVLGLTDANPAKTVELPDRTERYVHALTDAQVRQVQRVARTQIDDTRTPAVLALMISGAATIEIASVTVADVDLPNRRVWVHDGGYRYRPRWITLDDWCLDAVTRRVTAVPHDPLYVGTETDRALVARRSGVETTLGKQQSVMAAIVTGVLKGSGVYQPGVTRAESIREWLAVRVYNETGSLEQAAARLGMSSLDSIAHIVGCDWVTDLSTDGPPAHRRPALDQP